MANNLTFSPIRIDTPGTTSAITHLITIKNLLWVSDDAAGKNIVALDQLRIHDKSGGNVIVSKRAETVGDGLELIGLDLTVFGLYVTTMAGGILLITVE